ncbi:MAG: indole-3-glycerol phosphate synthase TrpC [Spirochaetaceae bacterium]|jgi:indole-3-glycerol phosphate synthase|nr:indole-3-glycerol phosphate synthase TrpC [Spirochaetaceae bacterium]
MILDVIVKASHLRVEQALREVPREIMQEKARTAAQPAAMRSFHDALALPGISFICEIKRASPSKGIIVKDFPYRTIAREYTAAGAAALSVLTEPEFFLGSAAYLHEIAFENTLPVLRKDFIVDDYQIYEAKTLGASAVLLICALLDAAKLRAYLECAHALGLDALVEAHDEYEVQQARDAGARIIGVNNRDLQTFTVDLRLSERLRMLVPDDTLFVAESGISTVEDVRRLADANIDALLIGEAMMRAADKSAYLARLRGDLV